MTAPAILTSPPMGTYPEPGMLDSRGAIKEDIWPAWIHSLRAAGWTVQRIADELGCDKRLVRSWQSKRRVPSLAVRRLAWRALWAPLEAEVMRSIQSRPEPSQATPEQARAILAKRKAGKA